MPAYSDFMEERIFICVDCAAKIYSTTRNVQRCEACRPAHNRKIAAKSSKRQAERRKKNGC